MTDRDENRNRRFFFFNSPIIISLLSRKETKLAIFSKIFAKIYPARETETGLAIIVFQNIANPAFSRFQDIKVGGRTL
jgi:hypothetical protein